MVKVINTYIHIHHDAFNESDHPRASNGQFGAGGGPSEGAAQKHRAYAAQVRASSAKTKNSSMQKAQTGEYLAHLNAAESHEGKKSDYKESSTNAHQVSAKVKQMQAELEANGGKSRREASTWRTNRNRHPSAQ